MNIDRGSEHLGDFFTHTYFFHYLFPRVGGGGGVRVGRTGGEWGAEA